MIGDNAVITVGSKTGNTNFELVPLELMKDNPYNLNLGIPSICLTTQDIRKEHARLTSINANITEIVNHGGKETFSIMDEEGNAYALIARI